jgi:hypothetical protein
VDPHPEMPYAWYDRDLDVSGMYSKSNCLEVGLGVLIKLGSSFNIGLYFLFQTGTTRLW